MIINRFRTPFVHKTKPNITKRAFSGAAPTIWNQLHKIITIIIETIDTFHKKTDLLEIDFPPYISAVLAPMTTLACPRI